MTSEQTIESIIRRISSDDNTEMAARFHELTDGLKARLDALESAATPPRAAEQQWTHVREDNPGGPKYRRAEINIIAWDSQNGGRVFRRPDGTTTLTPQSAATSASQRFAKLT